LGNRRSSEVKETRSKKNSYSRGKDVPYKKSRRPSKVEALAGRLQPYPRRRG
jgi:hypothetical protein